ncbi:putative non-specific serine/threonine protein kinase [Helianthus anomalus]
MSSLEEELAPLRIPLIAITTATDNFAEVNLLKRGTKEDVYKGVLLWPWCEVDVEIEEDERMIVMEYVVNGSLDTHLSDPTLTWSQRLHICFGAALALSYWHENTPYFYKGRFRILLDKDWEAKVVIRIDSESENSDVYRLGVVLMEVLYGRKATIKDVFECLDKMRRKYHDGDTWMISFIQI